MNSNVKTAIFWVVLIMVVVLLWTVVRTGQKRADRQLTFTQFVNDVKAGKVSRHHQRQWRSTAPTRTTTAACTP